MFSHAGEVVDEDVDIMSENMQSQSRRHVDLQKRRKNLKDSPLTLGIVKSNRICMCPQNVLAGPQCVKPPVHV